MAQTIRLKRTSVPGNTWANAPTFLSGEMALNTADKKLWVGDVDNTSAIEILTENSTIDADTLGTLSSSDFARDTHKYHSFVNGTYYYDAYDQGNNFRLFTENFAFEQLRHGTIHSIEYYDYASPAWTTWTGGESTIQTLLDGRENTQVGISHTNRTFRFTSSRSSGWPTLGVFMLQSNWTGFNYPGATVTVETSPSISTPTWTLKETMTFTSANTGTQWGMHAMATSNLHNGEVYVRITVDITDWTDNGSYTTFPLKRIALYSNYSGSAQEPWTWDYNKNMIFSGNVKSPSFIENGTALSSKYASISGNTAQDFSTNNLTVAGNLTVQGTTTTLNTADLVVEDKNIILGNVATPSDTTADGGGITLLGTTNKTISWSNATDSWNFNQGLNVTGVVTATSFSGDGANITNVNAQTLDNLDSTQFLRSDTSDTMTGQLSVTGNVNVTTAENDWAFKGQTTGSSNVSGLWFTGQTSRLILRDSTGNIITAISANGTNADNVINGNTIWHAGNDGAGSGLDADKLDGIESSQIIYGTNAYGTLDGRIDLNTITKTGHYWASSATNKPSTENGTIHHINHDGSTTYASQMFIGHDGTRASYIRTKDAGVWQSWQKIWTDTSDGANSGLDADKLDGIHASSFLRSDTSDTMTGDLSVIGSISIDNNISIDTGTGSTSTTTATNIATFDGTVYGSGKFIIQVKDTVTGEYQSSELLVVHNGTTASSTEYGVVYTGALLAGFDVNYNAGTIEIQATATSTNAMNYTVSKNLIKG